MNRCKRPRTREYAPTKSGSLTRPERVNVRCTTEECGRLLHDVSYAVAILKMRDPEAPTDIATAIHRVIVPVFEKIVRAYRYGSAAEQAAALIYLEEFVREDDYIRNRHKKYQMKLDV